MRALQISPLVRDGFSLKPHLDGEKLVVEFAGNGDMEAVDALGAYLKLVHREAVELAANQVTFDFGSLYFMNSSCFKAFVTLIDVVGRTEPQAYAVRFRTNPRIHWQRRSLEALRYLAPNVVEVEAANP